MNLFDGKQLHFIMEQFFVTITGESSIIGGKIYHYPEDNFDNKTKIKYQCQKVTLKYDYVLKDPDVEIQMFARKKKNKDFIYLGKVEKKTIIQDRKDSKGVLVVEFDVKISTDAPVIPKPTTKGDGKFKLPLFKAFNVEPVKKNYKVGIMQVRPLVNEM
jgi:hypothetical protein